MIELEQANPEAEAPLWQGDSVDFETLYDRNYRLVFGIAERMSGRADVAEEIAQVVFLKLWRSRGLYRQGNLSGWLSRVTRNQTLDFLRRARPTVPLDYLPGDTSSIDDILERNEAEWIRAIVLRGLSELKRDQLSVIELGFFGGLTHVEIARETGTPLGTVKARIRRGLQHLRVGLSSAAN